MAVDDKQRASRGSPKERFTKDHSKFCEYHNFSGHDTSECSMLKREASDRLQHGRLTDLVKGLKSRTTDRPPALKQPKEEPRTGEQRRAEILTISSEPATEEHQLIFSKCPHEPSAGRRDDPLVIQGKIGRAGIHRIYVDTGSAADVMFERCFWRLPREYQNTLEPPRDRLTSFSGHEVWPIGTTLIPLTIHDHRGKKRKTETIRFTIVRASSEYNIILGRRGLSQFEAIPSTVHGLLRFQTSQGPATARGNGNKATVYSSVNRQITHDEEGDEHISSTPTRLTIGIPIKSNFWIYYPTADEMAAIIAIVTKRNGGEGNQFPKESETQRLSNYAIAISERGPQQQPPHETNRQTTVRVMEGEGNESPQDEAVIPDPDPKTNNHTPGGNDTTLSETPGTQAKE